MSVTVFSGIRYIKNVKQNAWNDVSLKLGIAVDAIEKKITSLTRSYRREKSRHKNSLTTGSGNFFVHSVTNIFRLLVTKTTLLTHVAYILETGSRNE